MLISNEMALPYLRHEALCLYSLFSGERLDEDLETFARLAVTDPALADDAYKVELAANRRALPPVMIATRTAVRRLLRPMLDPANALSRIAESVEPTARFRRFAVTALQVVGSRAWHELRDRPQQDTETATAVLGDLAASHAFDTEARGMDPIDASQPTV